MHMRCLGRGLGSNFRLHAIEYCENINLSPSYYVDTSSYVLVEDLYAKLGEELKGRVGTRIGVVDAVRLIVPVTSLRGKTEGIRTLTTERVPETNREAKPFLHGLAEDYLWSRRPA